MPKLKDLFSESARLVQAGEMEEAKKRLSALLAEDPAFAPALHLLGLIAFQDRAYEEALPLFERAVRVEENALYLGNLATTQKALGFRPEAEATYRRALSLRKDVPNLVLGLGTLLMEEKRFAEARDVLGMLQAHPAALYFTARVFEEEGEAEEAEATYRRVLELAPTFAEAENDFGVFLRRRGRGPEALIHFEQAVALKPSFLEARRNLGTLAFDLKLYEKAETAFHEALALVPDHPVFLRLMGGFLVEQGREAEAVPVFQKLSVLAPSEDVLNDLGLALAERGEAGDGPAATEALRRAAALAPENPVILNNLAVALKAEGKAAEAEPLYRSALALRPVYHEAAYNLALLLLQQERFEEGLPLFERRLEKGMTGKAAPKEPLYAFPRLERLQDAAGKTILIHPEQAFGDMILFIRGAEALKQAGATVWVVARPPLTALLKTLPWGNRVLSLEEALGVRADAWVSVLSLPALAGWRKGALPAPIPYFAADAGKVQFWQKKLAGFGSKKKIGLLAAGKPRPLGRSIPLEAFSFLAAKRDAVFISLSMEKTEAPAGLSLYEAGREIKDFSDTAALLKTLDLFISIDSAPAHLAGALGIPTWVLLRAEADWRWFKGTDRSPFYPSLRLFRQTKAGQWGDVLAEVEKALEEDEIN